MKKNFLRSFLILVILLAFQLVFPLVNAYALTTNNDVLPPSNLSSQLITPSNVKLSWSSVYGANGYNVYGIVDSQLKLLGTTTSTSYTFNNLPEGSYRYVVSTLSADGESGPCAPVSVNIVYPSMATPTNLTNKVQNGNDIVLSWTASQYAEAYNLYQIDADGQKTLLTSSKSYTYSITNVDAGTYTYAVSAVNSLYGESPLSTSTQVQVILPTMTAPSNLTYSLSNGNDITLRWNTIPYATSYKIYQVIDGEKVLKSTLTGTSVTYTNKQAGDYIYEVHSFSSRFGESDNGSQALFTLVMPTMQSPGNLTNSITNGNDITLKWNTVPYATAYKVYQIIDGQKVLISTLAGTSVTYTNKQAGDYVYEVHSYSDRFGESQYESQTSFTLILPTMQPPDNLSYTITNGNDITLKWNTTPYATSYKLYQIIDGQKVLKSTLTGTSTTLSNMPSGDYVYEIHSYSDRFYESNEGSIITFSLIHPVMQSPTNLVQTIKNATDFTLSWNASPYATSYKVYQIVNGQKVLKSTVTGTTVSYTSMLPGEYNFEVYSYSTRFGESANGSSITVNLNGQTMQAPTNLTYSITNGNDITLRWTAVPYATSYKIYQMIDDQQVLKQTIYGTSVTFSNMVSGDYDYIVNSISNLLGESPIGAETTFSLIHPTMEAPSNLAYKIQNGNDVQLTWSAVPYANSYKIYEVVNGQFVLKTTVTSTSTTMTNVIEGNHDYIIKSVSARFGESQDGSQVSFSLVFPTMLEPSNFTYNIANGNDITLKWNSVSYATSYKIYQIINGEKILKQTVTGTSITFTNVPEGDYTYEVYSYSNRFGESQVGSQTNLTLVFPVMHLPTNLTNSTLNGNDINLRWATVPYATNYKVYQIVDGEKILKQTVTGTSVTFTNMPEGDYVYEIHSYSSRFGESNEGSSVSFKLTWPVVQPPTLSRTVSNVNNITLSWQSVNWANEYRVYEIINDTKQLIYKGTALSYKVFNLSEGTHSFQITAYSNRFGESTLSKELTENIIYPVMQSPVANLKLIDKTSGQITWDFITYANGYNVYEIIDNKPVLLVKNLNNLSYTITDLSYANHQYYVTSFSNSFGESDPSNTVIAKLIVDTKPPVTSANAPTNWSNDNVTINLSSTDDMSDVVKTFYSIDGSNYLEGSSFKIQDEGIHKVSFYSIDAVGNIERTNTIYVKIDKTAPVTTSNAPNNWSNNDVTINLASSDELSGVVKTFYSIDGSNYLEGSSFTIQDEGIHKISFYSIDAAGNIESTNTVYVKIDKTAPTITMDLFNEFKLGTTLQLAYLANDGLSGVSIENMVVFEPNGTTGKLISNGTNIQLDKPGVYTVVITVTDSAGNSTPIKKQFTVYIPANIEVTSKVIKGNNGVFTVRVSLPLEYSAPGFDLNTAEINGVNALTSNNGYYNQAKIGQFKFERSDFNWTAPEVVVEFRCYIDGYLVVGQTTVKVQN
jgi:large repetitive protein